MRIIFIFIKFIRFIFNSPLLAILSKSKAKRLYLLLLVKDDELIFAQERLDSIPPKCEDLSFSAKVANYDIEVS